jgi:hypothetical protein
MCACVCVYVRVHVCVCVCARVSRALKPTSISSAPISAAIKEGMRIKQEAQYEYARIELRGDPEATAEGEYECRVGRVG